MSLFNNLKSFFAKKSALHYSIKKIFDFSPNNIDLYFEALIHKSHKRGKEKNNERLEYLGDAVLDLIIANKLYEEFPDANEGDLTKLKSKIVSREHLLELAKKLRLYEKLPIKKQKSLDPDHIIGNALEAIIGAIFLDKGYDKTVKITLNMLDRHVDILSIKNKIVDFKSKVHEWAQVNKCDLRFEITSIGNLENSLYRAELFINNDLKGHGEAKNKKTAERKASEMSWKTILDKSLF